jgi:hypothetical protein
VQPCKIQPKRSCNISVPPVIKDHKTNVPKEDCQIIHDSGATVSIFRNKSLLKNVRNCKPMIISGIEGGDIKITKLGEFGDYGNVYLDERVSSNVLSLSEAMSRGHSTKRNDKWRTEHVRTKGGKMNLTFKLINGLFTRNCSDHLTSKNISIKFSTTPDTNEEFHQKVEIQGAGEEGGWTKVKNRSKRKSHC